MTMGEGAIRLPYRVVDRENQGWHPIGHGDRDDMYAADYGRVRDLADRPYAQLVLDRGPLRPVEPITTTDCDLLQAAMRDAGRKAITTLAAALEQVAVTIREQHGGLSKPAKSYEFSMRTMMAGREGSWESELLIKVILFGNRLNLDPAKKVQAASLDEWRKAGPAKRVDRAVRDMLADMFMRWVASDDRYTEVAETLAFEVSSYADQAAGPDGWRTVADQWLQPSGMAEDDIGTCYGLFYSRSEFYDPDAAF